MTIKTINDLQHEFNEAIRETDIDARDLIRLEAAARFDLAVNAHSLGMVA